MSVTMKKIATMKTVAIQKKEELADGFELHHIQPVFGSTRSDPSSTKTKMFSRLVRSAAVAKKE